MMRQALKYSFFQTTLIYKNLIEPLNPYENIHGTQTQAMQDDQLEGEEQEGEDDDDGSEIDELDVLLADMLEQREDEGVAGDGDGAEAEAEETLELSPDLSTSEHFENVDQELV